MSNINFSRPELNEDGSVKNREVSLLSSLLEYIGLVVLGTVLIMSSMIGARALIDYSKRTNDFSVRNYVLITMFIVIAVMSLLLVRLIKRAKETMNHEVLLHLKSDHSVSIIDVVPAKIDPIWNGHYTLSVKYPEKNEASLSVFVNNKSPEILGLIMKNLREIGISVTRNQNRLNKAFASHFQ